MGGKREIVPHPDERLDGYDNILRDIRSLLERARFRAHKAIDNLRVQTYWQVGERIVRGELEHKDRADYGDEVIKKLAIDLDMKKSVLYDILQFYRTYSIFHALRGNLSWTHYRTLMRIGEKDKRAFYERSALRNSWSTRELERQIRAKTYEKTIENGELIIPAPQLLEPITPEEAFKDTYDFEFLSMDGDYEEAELEKALVSHVEKLLLEFGRTFHWPADRSRSSSTVNIIRWTSSSITEASPALSLLT